MKIEVGQRWRYIGTSGEFYTYGREYAVTAMPENPDDMFQLEDNDGGPHYWGSSKTDFHSRFELADGPVRTVTRKEIMPGTYGRLSVNRISTSAVGVELLGGGVFTSGELRSVASHIVLLADALDEVANA